MQGFLFSDPGSSLTPFAVVVTCERLPGGRRVCWLPGVGRPRPPEALRVVILYEDFATGLRARKFCRLLAQGLGASEACEPALCLWEVLDEPLLQRRAARAVARADLLVLSVHRHLPAVPTGALLDAWLAAKARRACYLVAMVDDLGGGSAAACLCELAWRRGLDCLEQRIEDPDNPQRGGLALVWVA
jgi:hypothetical protein